jgi:hypothetical protein
MNRRETNSFRNTPQCDLDALMHAAQAFVSPHDVIKDEDRRDDAISPGERTIATRRAPTGMIRLGGSGQVPNHGGFARAGLKRPRCKDAPIFADALPAEPEPLGRSCRGRGTPAA